MKRLLAALVLSCPALLLAGGTGCGFLPESSPPNWTDQLQADSPCFEVNLLDGLDESSTEELVTLYDCLNYHGHFTSLGPTVDTLDAPTRDGVGAGIEIARLVNALPDADVDVFGLAELALDMLQAEDRPIDEFMDLSLELVYGERAVRLRSGDVLLTDEDAMKRGIAAPLADVLPVAAESLLDDDLRAATWAGDLVADPETKRWIKTFGSATRSNDATVSSVSDDLLPHLGEAIDAAHTPNNDRWVGASGNSLRDLADALAGGNQPVIEAIGPEATTILSDAAIRSSLPNTLVALHEDGVLQQLGPQLRWMSSVNVDASPVGASEASSLHAFLRLVAATNEPMTCSLDLWVTNLDIELGNVAVTILGVLADMDPDTVQTTTGLLGAVLGWDLSGWILDEVADSGVCPTLTPQVMDDLQAVEVMYEDDAKAVLITVIDLLSVFKYGQDSKLEEVADLITVVVDAGAVPPAEEALRDLGTQPLVGDIVDLVPVLVDPESYDLDAVDEPAVDFQDLVTVLLWVWEPDGNRTGWERMEPLVQPLLAEDATWALLDNAAPLLRDRQSQTSRIFELVPPLLDLDPELTLLDTLAPLVGDEALARPLLRLLEVPELPKALLATRAQGDDPEVPMAFWGRLVVNGALDDILRMVDLLLDALTEEETP